MFTTRFSFAHQEVDDILPQTASVVVFNAQSADQITALRPRHVTAVQGFAPVVHALTAAGIRVVQDVNEDFDAAIVLLPKSKSLARDMTAKAAACVKGGVVLVDGQKSDGIDSVLKDLKRVVSLGPILSKAHGKISWFDADADLSAWRSAPIDLGDGFQTVAGVFSADGVDPASALLAKHVAVVARGVGADLGSGWGYLTRNILAVEHVKTLFAIEADFDAHMIAQKNCVDARVQFCWDDVAKWAPPKPLDFVVSNPPFHTFGQADPKIGIGFIQTAARILGPSGQFLMVANRHLPYEETLEQCFQMVSELDGTPKFKVFLAARPRKSKR